MLYNIFSNSNRWVITMEISTKRLFVRGKSKSGSVSYALPLTRRDLQALGLSGDLDKTELLVKIKNHKMVVQKAES